jgi:formylglycine-generating enzyme required for sulfatase activity
MVLIPAGEFQMGDSLDGMDLALPVHTVYLDAFYMDIYEVTNAQYLKFMDATGHSAPVYWDDSRFNVPEHPVVGVSWHDAVAYAEWAGKRLPTEAEWEKAARGGLVGKRYSWGSDSPDGTQCNFADVNTDYDWSDKSVDDGYSRTSPVGSFSANGYGLYDMAGNVWDWCSDWYDSSYYSSSPSNNPKGPSSGSQRVMRGGSWSRYEDFLRCAYRSSRPPTDMYGYIGFRCSK